MQWVNTSLYLGIMRRTYPFLAQLIIEGGREDGVLHIVVGALPRDAHTPAEEQQCEKHRVNRRFLLYKAASNWAYSGGSAVYAEEARGHRVVGTWSVVGTCRCYRTGTGRPCRSTSPPYRETRSAYTQRATGVTRCLKP